MIPVWEIVNLELMILPRCSIQWDDTISPNPLDRPLRKPRRSPDRGFSLASTSSVISRASTQRAPRDQGVLRTC